MSNVEPDLTPVSLEEWDLCESNSGSDVSSKCAEVCSTPEVRVLFAPFSVGDGGEHVVDTSDDDDDIEVEMASQKYEDGISLLLVVVACGLAHIHNAITRCQDMILEVVAELKAWAFG